MSILSSTITGKYKNLEKFLDSVNRGMKIIEVKTYKSNKKNEDIVEIAPLYTDDFISIYSKDIKDLNFKIKFVNNSNIKLNFFTEEQFNKIDFSKWGNCNFRFSSCTFNGEYLKLLAKYYKEIVLSKIYLPFCALYNKNLVDDKIIDSLFSNFNNIYIEHPNNYSYLKPSFKSKLFDYIDTFLNNEKNAIENNFAIIPDYIPYNAVPL